MNPTRRDFVRTGAALAAASLPFASPAKGSVSQVAPTADSVIFLMLTGGPSQLDTWDPKPDAPSEYRGPFAPIRTRVSGVRVSELFPKLAGILDKVALVRSVHHDGPAIHEAGFQLVNSGRYFGEGQEWPSVGAVTDVLMGRSEERWMNRSMLPLQANTGLAVSHGQGYGWLKPTCGHLKSLGACAGFKTMCRRAAMMHERHRYTVINQFVTVFDAPSWDCHAAGGNLNTTLTDVRDLVAPSFDTEFTDLIRYLDETGRLDRTLVVATGEFGRTPRLNSGGGRDHWPGCWTTLFAGGGVKGGQVIGASDAIGSEPKDRPVHARDIPATIFRVLGIGPDATIPGPDGLSVRVYEGQPVLELF